MIKLLFSICAILLIGCTDLQDTKRPKKSHYVPPSINYKGKFRKGHIRKSVSTKPSAIRNQAKSRYYYKTRGKYRRKKK